ncbi:MAG TPA: orotidine-5'-phosphate decarboxylase [Ktedonobacteraceae bacterium]|jgi:orotidine-5'-phosphate decarboxylase
MTTQTSSTFLALLEGCWRKQNFVCVGLDPEYSRIPAIVKQADAVDESIFRFNRGIIDATHDLVCAYKPNSAFYEALGESGLRALRKTIHYIKEHYLHIPVILDAKRADIGNTNQGYVSAIFDYLDADAVTVHPYLGREALLPFLERKDKGILVLVKTSNAGSDELQNLPVGAAQEPLYQVVARQVARDWNTHGNCALVVGATYPAELRQIRAIAGDVPILIPGVGAQGGDVAATVQAGKDSRGWGMIISSSRGIIFASSEDNFALAARQATIQLRDMILTAL